MELRQIRCCMQAMRERYPDVQLHLVESLSSHSAGMLQSREIDLAILFAASMLQRWSVQPLLDRKLFAIASTALTLQPARRLRPAQLAGVRLILPSHRRDQCPGGQRRQCRAVVRHDGPLRRRQRSAARSRAARLAAARTAAPRSSRELSHVTPLA